MSISRITITGLLLALLASNAFWLYSAVQTPPKIHDKPMESVPCTPEENLAQLAQTYDSAVLPLMAAISSSAKPGATKESVIDAAVKVSRRNFNAFCMEQRDVVVAQGIGLKFDATGKLIGATDMYCPP